MAGTADIVAIQKAWRKIQGGVGQGINVECEEIGMIDNLAKEDQPYSFRENTIVVDLNEEGGIASINEGDFEAEEGSVGLNEYEIEAQHFIGRFSISNLAKYADKGQENQLERDLTLRAAKKMQAMAAHVSDYFYGSNTGVLATTDTDFSGATATLALTAGYGNTGITDAGYLARMFKAQDADGRGGDTIALINGSSLVANTFARVTARDTTAGTITVAAAGSNPAITTNGLKVVKANSKGRSTVAHTDYLKGLVGMQDILFGSSLHGLTHANWTPAYSDTAAGRFTGAKLNRADAEIGDYGSGKADTVMIDRGVYRDLTFNVERAGLRHVEAFGMEIDGSVKSKGRKFFQSRRVPPGWVVPFSSKALKKWQILPMPSNKVQWADGKEFIDQSGMVFRMETVLGLVVTNRKQFSYFTNQTRA